MATREEGTSEKGFTLVELLIVVAIIGILAAIAVVNFRGAMERSRQTKTMTTVRNLGTALHAYQLDTGLLPPDGTTSTDLATMLRGSAFSVVETRDGWGTGIEYHAALTDYTLRSYGSDHVLGPTDISRATRDVYANDIVMTDGVFVNSPQQ